MKPQHRNTRSLLSKEEREFIAKADLPTAFVNSMFHMMVVSIKIEMGCYPRGAGVLRMTRNFLALAVKAQDAARKRGHPKINLMADSLVGLAYRLTLDAQTANRKHRKHERTPA